MLTTKLVPSELKYIFTRTNWQSDENKKAQKLDPTIQADGVEFEKIAIHFPPDFLLTSVFSYHKWVKYSKLALFKMWIFASSKVKLGAKLVE